MYKTAKLLTIPIVFFLLFASCAPSRNSGNSFSPDDGYEVTDRGPVYGGTLNLATLSPDTLNPLLTKDIYTKDILGIIFESLVELDNNFRPVPVLAERWEVSEGGLIWTFYLRKNVIWHDGMPFTAEDVEYTLKLLSNPSVDSIYKNSIEKVTIFEVVDKYTIRLLTSTPYAFLPEQMTFPIVPEHIFGSLSGGGLLAIEKPIGTGPYKYVEHDKKNIVMTVNGKWWGGTPYITNIVVKICRNYNEYLNSVQVRESDILRVKREDLSRFNNRVHLEVKKIASKEFDFIAFNFSNPVLNDKAVRQAIAYGIDKFRLLDYLLKGRVVPAEIPLPQDSHLFNRSINPYHYDITKTRSLLKSSGWKDEQIIWSKTDNGQRYTTEFELLVNSENEIRCKLAEEISSRLAALGIRITVKQAPWEEVQRLISERNFDMVLTGWNISNVPDLSFAYSSLQVDGGNNIAGYASEKTDELLRHVLMETNEDRRRERMYDLQITVSDDIPFIGLYFINDGVICSKNIKGPVIPHCNDIYANISKWYIPTE